MYQLELLPAHLVTVAREYQNGEIIQVANRSWRHNHAALVVNSKGCRINAFSIPDNLRWIRIIGYAAAEKESVACASVAARHIGVLRIVAQHPEADLLSLG